MKGRTFHVCVHIEDMLQKSNRTLNGLLAINGRELTGKEVKEYLKTVQAEQGYTHYSGCDNMNSDGRCAGHPSEATT
ncbi:hypothetical protein [uncultured Endozoicomonas sp.]|uniref:hypothetical protein n=1 Tax=uncultured Endozoicomonas sp. TaxID=432652 RepID=UPI002630934C|nr:hypothetical protein [uncultured Endozoicomonas sp.]